MKLGDAGVRNTRERGKSTAYCEIGFDSKPISEIDLKEEMHLKVGVGSGNSCNEG